MSKITGLQNEIIEERLRLQEIGQTTPSKKLKDLQKQYIQKLQNNKKLRSFNRRCNADFKKIYNDWANTYSKSETLEEFWAKYVNVELFDTRKYVGQINNLCQLNLNSIKYSRKSQQQLLTSTIMNNNMELVRAVETESKDIFKAITSQAYMEQWTDKEYKDTLRGTGAIKPLQINGRFIRPETRLKSIARTEPMRAYNTTSYIVNKERGAEQWYAIGFDDEYTCTECIEVYGEIEEPILYDIDDTRYIPPLHPNCYVKDTLIFTKNGFKPIQEVSIKDKVLTLNPETETTSFINPVNTIKHYEKEIVHINHKWFETKVTKDHDLFIHQRRDDGKRGRYFEPQFRKPHELNSESYFVQRIKPKTNGLKDNDYAFIMAWYLSEGSIRSKNTFKISQEIKENRDIIIPRFKQIFKDVKIRDDCIIINHHEWTDYLKQFGRSHEKYIPDDVFKLNKESLQVFIDNYVKGDGHERTSKYGGIEKSIYTSSPKLRDGIVYILIQMGLSCSIGVHSKAGTKVKHHNGVYTQNHDIYRISIKNSKHIGFDKCKVETQTYNDYVYCVDIPPYHTILTCYNGKIAWNGNCRHTIVYSWGKQQET